MSCVCHALASVHCCLWSPEGKWSASWLLFVVLIVILFRSHWYLGIGVVLDCFDS